MNDNILLHLPIDRQLPFYEGAFYTLNELLKTIHDTHIRDLIKVKLCELRLKLIQLNPKYNLSISP